MKTTYIKSQPKIITYCSYKYFNIDSFREALLQIECFKEALLQIECFKEALLQIECNGNNCDESFKDFTSSCNIVLNEQALQKKKYVRCNQS